MTYFIRFSLLGLFFAGLVAGCGMQAAEVAASPSSVIATRVDQQDMKSWQVQLIPTPLMFQATYLGRQAINPAMTIYTKKTPQSSWHYVLSSSSHSKLTHDGRPLVVKWPENTPQLYGRIKVVLRWYVEGQQHIGYVVYNIKSSTNQS